MEIYSDNGMDIILKLPFTMKGTVHLYMSGDNLLVEVGQYRRSIALTPSREKNPARRV